MRIDHPLAVELQDAAKQDQPLCRGVYHFYVDGPLFVLPTKPYCRYCGVGLDCFDLEDA